MSSLSQFGGGTPVGQIIQGQFANNSRYLPCDGNDYVSATYPLLDKTNLNTLGTNSPIARTLPTSQVWSATASNGSVIVAVSSTSGTSAASTSDGGVTWVSRTIPTGVYRAVTWNGTVFCAVGTNVCATSPDGITWTARTITALDYTGVAWTNQSGLFVVVANVFSQDVQTSPDGITWTTRSTVLPNNDSRQAIFNVNGQFWALPKTNSSAGSSNVFSVSDDGLLWKSRGLPDGSSSNWGCAGYLNGKYYLNALQAANGVYVSPDGYTWSLVNSGVLLFGVFIAGGYVWANTNAASTRIEYSLDGLNWKVKTLPSSQTWGNISASSNGIVILPLASGISAASIAIDNTKFRTPLARPALDTDRLYIKVA